MNIDIRKIKKLIALLEESGLSEIEIKEGELSLRLSRQGAHFVPAALPVHHQERHSPVNIPTQPHSSPTPSEQVSAAPIATHSGHVVRSPMVGTFYSASSPDSPPFVSIGQQVRTGDVLGIIEAMKMFNEVESDCTGKIIDILVKNGEPIEFDQPLFIIEE